MRWVFIFRGSTQSERFRRAFVSEFAILSSTPTLSLVQKTASKKLHISVSDFKSRYKLVRSYRVL